MIASLPQLVARVFNPCPWSGFSIRPYAEYKYLQFHAESGKIDGMMPPPGFQALNSNKPIRVYRRNLPHWRQEGATYFVTFHLNDSLPMAALEELDQLRKRAESRRRGQSDDEVIAMEKAIFTRVQYWVNQGHGACYFNHFELRSMMHDAILYWHAEKRKRVDVGAFVVMPNHTHILVRPLEGTSLEWWLKSIKGFSAREVNKAKGRTGSIWFEESHDRIVRDVSHLNRCVRYIGRNAVNAGIQRASHVRWLNPDWEALGYAFAD